MQNQLASMDYKSAMMSLRHFMFRWRIKVKLKKMVAHQISQEHYDYNAYMNLATEVQARVKHDFQGFLLKHMEPI